MKRNLATKSLLSFLLGFPLALAVCGLYGWLGVGSMVDKYMVVLWLLVPVWTLIFCLSVRLSSPLVLSGVLLGANLIGFALLYLVRTF